MRQTHPANNRTQHRGGIVENNQRMQTIKTHTVIITVENGRLFSIKKLERKKAETPFRPLGQWERKRLNVLMKSHK